MCSESPETLWQLLTQICRLSHGRMHALWDEIGLHKGQPFVLRILWDHNGQTHSELAERLHVQPATISNMLKRMEKAGLVARRPDPDDRRVSRVYLTDAGRDIQSQVERVWHELEERAFVGLSQAEQAEMRRFLLCVRDNMLPDDCKSADKSKG